MQKILLGSILIILFASSQMIASEAKLVRYPHYHNGYITFTYLGDIWTADESGRNTRRITVNAARDVAPRFSPDGRWIAFSSNRNGNMDVFLVPTEGGIPKQLTFHSADDTVLDWLPNSNAILFTSNRGEGFMPKLYTVAVTGGIPRDAGADMGVYASYSPDGKQIAINRKSQAYWRKGYRGAYQSDITVFDVTARRFTDITDFDGMDSWPMWSRDHYIYFVSDREGGGQSNIWKVAEAGGKAVRVTSFKTGAINWPSMSGDGRVIVFEHEFGIWKLELPSGKTTKIKLEIAAETQQSLSEMRSFSQVDDFDLAPSSRRIVFSTYGDIFTAPTGESGDLVQITNGAARDKNPQYSPDGKWISFISDRSGREEIYLSDPEGAGELRRLTEIDALKFGYAWSPNSKEIAFSTSDNMLRKYNLDTKQTSTLLASKFGVISVPAWSPDGKWLVYSKPDHTRANSIYILAAAGGEDRRLTVDTYGEVNPRFSPDGKKVYFVRMEGATGVSNFFTSAQIYSVNLEREERDPSEPENNPEAVDQGGESSTPRTPKPRQEPREPVTIDWAGMRRRTRQLTRVPMAAFSFAISPDSRTVVFASSERNGTQSIPAIYSIQADGKRPLRLLTGGGGSPVRNSDGGEENMTPSFGAFSHLHFSRDGRTIFFKEGTSVSSSGLTPSPAGATRRRIGTTVRIKINLPDQWAQMFEDAWRTMKYRFYDAGMHGKDWDAARVRYQPLVKYVGDRQEVLNLINEMIGELNASHTGAAPPRSGLNRQVSTDHLGVELVPDEQAGRYRVAHIYKDGPADKDWVRVTPGDFLIAINGKAIKAGDNYWEVLNSRLNRKVEVTFNNKSAEEGSWKARIEPVTASAFSQLRYERWVSERRDMVDKLSGGRVGYLHIQAMNQQSLRRFETELRRYHDKEALVIDQRWNSGGNIDQELLGLLVQRRYQIWHPRGTEPMQRPFTGFFGPKVILQNWRSASNAEMFPAAFRALGLGKVIGTNTMGAVIGTNSYTLIDGSTVRTPSIGVYLANEDQTNLENYGVRPDIFVENPPEEVIRGKDRQLETAVRELLKDLSKGQRQATKR